MILVELFFQELNQQYDVHLDEQLPIEGVIDSLIELIAQKEHLRLSSTPGMFVLCDLDRKQILHPQTTLSENGIRSGQKLFLL